MPPVDYYGSFQPAGQLNPDPYSYQTGTLHDAYGRPVGSSSAGTTPAPSNRQGAYDHQ